MRRSVLLVFVGLTLMAEPGIAEVGIGISGGYPVGPLGYMAEGGLEYTQEPIFFGALFRYQHDERAFGLEAEFLFWPYGEMFVFHVDGMLTSRLAFLRLSIGAGVNVVSLVTSGSGSFSVISPDVTTRLGVRIGPVGVGIGFSMPVNMLWRAIVGDFPIVKNDYDLLSLFAGQVTANVTYWF